MSKSVSEAARPLPVQESHPAIGIAMGTCTGCKVRMNLMADPTDPHNRMKFLIPDHSRKNSNNSCTGSSQAPAERARK